MNRIACRFGDVIDDHFSRTANVIGGKANEFRSKMSDKREDEAEGEKLKPIKSHEPIARRAIASFVNWFRPMERVRVINLFGNRRLFAVWQTILAFHCYNLYIVLLRGIFINRRPIDNVRLHALIHRRVGAFLWRNIDCQGELSFGRSKYRFVVLWKESEIASITINAIELIDVERNYDASGSKVSLLDWLSMM